MNKISMRLGAAAAAALSLSATALAVPVIENIDPARQRVHERIVLRGSGFGSYVPGVSRVLFIGEGGTKTTLGGLPYAWRDDYIEIRVPVGDRNGGPVAKGPVAVRVVNADGPSNSSVMQILVSPNNALEFIEKTRLVDNADVSGFLGDGTFNQARTKDADVADINGDGYPDIIDNNSNNIGNDTHEVVYLNRFGLYFTPVNFEPRSAGDTDGPFLTTVPQNGVYPEDAVAYDGDWVDLTNDGLPDWVQAASRSNAQVRVVINGFQGQLGRFLESTRVWQVNPDYPSTSPDDISHVDVNFDGFVDVLAAFRFSPSAQLYLNDGGSTFGTSLTVSGANGSMHDGFFADYNADGFWDVILVNESGSASRLRNNGALPVPGFVLDGTVNESGFSGMAADFNADGVDDLAIAGAFDSNASVFINDPQNPGTFTKRSLPDVEQFTYDLEAADIDLDGDVDVIGTAVVTNANDNIRVWINDGTGVFSNATSPGTRDLFPTNGPYQRMSADVIDMDDDGDLDLYITGADGTGVFGFGAVTNQFWENRALGLSIGVSGTCPGTVTFDGQGATAGQPVILLRGAALQGRELPPGTPCPGLRLALQGFNVLSGTRAAPDGTFTIQADVPAQACGQFVQAIQFAGCASTSVSSIPD